MRVSPLALAALVLVFSTAGCASQKMERQVREARFRAAAAEERSAQLDVRVRAIETSMVFQQSMLGRSMAKQDATDRSIAALGDGLRSAPPASAERPSAQPASSPPAPPAASLKELVDLSGQTVVVGADDATVRNILTKVEAYMGRPLTANERQTLAQVLRRPRVMDTTNPWGSGAFNER